MRSAAVHCPPVPTSSPHHHAGTDALIAKLLKMGVRTLYRLDGMWDELSKANAQYQELHRLLATQVGSGQRADVQGLRCGATDLTSQQTMHQSHPAAVARLLASLVH